MKADRRRSFSAPACSRVAAVSEAQWAKVPDAAVPRLADGSPISTLARRRRAAVTGSVGRLACRYRSAAPDIETMEGPAIPAGT